MIYEYPKEFIVPVAYIEDLVQKRNESIREWNLFENQYEEHIYDYNMDAEDSDNDNAKNILNDIDEDYADSETLSM
jgi:hypothetical protein